MDESREVDARMPLIERPEADNKAADNKDNTIAPRSYHHQIPRVEAPQGDTINTDAAATRKRQGAAKHSGRGWDTKRRHPLEYKDGALQCLSPVGLTEETSPKRASEEIARCLHEPKVNLVKDAITVLGVKRVLQFFNETVKVQRTGGQCVNNGNTKRAPGGVFLTLIKNSPALTAAEKTDIFKKDKKIVADHKKQAQRRKKDAKLRSKGGLSNHATQQPNFNMSKRLFENQQCDTEEHMASEAVELDGGPVRVESASMSERVETPFVKPEEAEPMQVDENGSRQRTVKRGGAPPTSQQQVEMDLEEFERTPDVQLDIILDDV